MQIPPLATKTMTTYQQIVEILAERKLLLEELLAAVRGARLS